MEKVPSKCHAILRGQNSMDPSWWKKRKTSAADQYIRRAHTHTHLLFWTNCSCPYFSSCQPLISCKIPNQNQKDLKKKKKNPLKGTHSVSQCVCCERQRVCDEDRRIEDATNCNVANLIRVWMCVYTWKCLCVVEMASVDSHGVRPQSEEQKSHRGFLWSRH